MNNDTNQTAIIEHDISFQSIRKLVADYDLSLKELSGVIGCTPAQICSKTNKIGSGPALRILQLSHLMNLATGYFGSLSRAKKWFAEYNLGLDAKPIELCQTEKGVKQIENSIVRLAAGMTA